MSIDVILMGLAFITIHLLANDLIPAGRDKRLKWFSFSGGLAVSYVFVYVLPTLHKEQIIAKKHGDFFTMESDLYFVGLIGLLVFFAIQKVVRNAQNQNKEKKAVFLFWLQILFFGLYNMLVAYTVISHQVLGIQAVFYGLAVGLHFIAVAHDLWLEYEEIYNKYGRYVLAAGIVAGWFLGTAVSLPPLGEAAVFAFISGAMILNVIKYELPPDEEAHLGVFTAGVVFYTTVTMSLKFFFQW
jgi:hypothetical protein